MLVFDQARNRQLVAAIEIVSPANKDRPESRRAFVAKCAALLQKSVCVSIVDLVTIRHFNLYCDLLEMIGHSDPAFQSPPEIYAATCRNRKSAWAYQLRVGEQLPTLPIWLNESTCVSLDLESSYSKTCKALRLPE